MSGNLALWEAVERTPVEQTKPITGKQYNGNSPKPHHLVKRATETFGPIGIGWGFAIVEEGIRDGARYADGQCEKMHYAKVRVWFMWNNQRGEVEHVGGTIFSGRRKGGEGFPFTDDDAPKKSVTDALVKALSMIGFAGDIFLGRYDDSKYMAELKAEAAEDKKAASSPPERRQPPKSPAKAPAATNGKAAADEPPSELNDPIPFGEDDGQVDYVDTKGGKHPMDLDKYVNRLEQIAQARDTFSDEDFAAAMWRNAECQKRAAAAWRALWASRNMKADEWRPR